ncbi:MAG: DnaJ domain-containing protein [Clostridia bacterium]|nr:DnaJ domain-containing protein [Clostridia bacterium]
MNNPYEILGVHENASDEEIKNAYREKARAIQSADYSNSPLSDVADKKMKELDDAYDAVMAQRRSGKSYSSQNNYGTYTDTSYNSSYTPPTYQEIREKIRRNDIDAAQILLDNIPETSRIAEWYYLQGMIQQKKGWTNAAYENYTKAYQMDSSNPEYSRAYQMMNNQRSGGYRTSTGRNADSECGFCNICQGLICADCCCECMGGDIIPCC